MRFLIYIILIFKIEFLFSQEKIFTICDNNNESIPYANIVLDKKECIGTTTNINGIFKINTKQKYDTVEVSCIGYKTIKLDWRDFISQDTIFLINDVYKIPTVTIISAKSKIITIGSNNVKGYPGYISDIQGSETALYIKPTKKIYDKIIKNIQVYVTKKGIPNSDFRIIIYSVNNTLGYPKPDTIILKKNLINRAVKGNEWVNFDILKYNIKMPPKGIFISIMWLNISEKFTFSIKNKNFEQYGQVIKAVCSNDSRYINYVWYRNNLFDKDWKNQKDLMLPLIKCNIIY